MKRSNSTIITLISIAALSLVACGKKENVSTLNTSTEGLIGNVGDGSGGSGGNSTNTTYTFSGSVSGSTGYWVSPVINTDNRLVVTFTPDSYNAYGTSNCAKLNIQIEGIGSGQTTSYLRVGAGSVFCQNGATYATIDLSSSLVAGHGPVRIRISQVRNDRIAYQCIRSGGTQSYCSGFDLAALYTNHSLNFNIQAAVNGS